MAVPTGVWGIDVGQCALKALRLEIIDDVVTATAFDYVEHPKILSQPDADPDQLTREALETVLSRNSIKGDLVAMSIAGQSGLARFVKLPPVEEKKIADIVRFEAKQQIPFPLEEVVWDFQKIGSGTVTDGFALDTEIGLFAMKRDMISRFLHHFQAVNVEVHIVQMSPLALCNYVAYDLLKKQADGTTVAHEGEDEIPSGKKKCAVALDIGTDGSSLIITDGEKIIWQRPIPIGGNHFTRALTKEMKLTFAKAEHLKRNAAKSPDLAKILKALKPVLTDFVNEVQRSLGYFTNTHRDAHIAYMVGLGSAFRLPGLQKFLSEKLSLEVRKPTTFERLTGENVVSAPVFTENLLTFPVSFGLALQGLKLSRLTTNLLPHEIQFDRQIRAKKPWMVAAGAALLAGLGVLCAGYGFQSASLGNPIDPEKHNDRVAKEMVSSAGMVKKAQAQNSAATAREEEINKTTKDVKAIMAGKDERPNWVRLNEFIAACLPQPDGSNLHEVLRAGGDGKPLNQTIYWKRPEAQAAYEQFKARKVGQGNVIDVPLDEQSLQNLCNVDIEAIFPVYTDDLKLFFEAAKKKTKEEYKIELDGIDRFVPGEKKYSEMVPEGPGWVIELRGYTYHKGNHDFLVDTLVYNIDKRGFGKGLVPFSKDAAPPVTGKFPDPIDGRISHAFLFHFEKVRDPQPGVFGYINSSFVRDLLGGPAADGSGGGFGGVGGKGGSMGPSPAQLGGNTGSETTGANSGAAARSSWQPIGAAAAGGSAMGPMGSTGSGPRGGGPVGSVGGGGAAGAAGAAGVAGGGGTTGGSGEPAAANPSGVKRERTEFIVYFIWREPTLDQAPAK
ncbi:MAG: type IV pilus assembly protein PilM [Gemmataceae bacterium]